MPEVSPPVNVPADTEEELSVGVPTMLNVPESRIAFNNAVASELVGFLGVGKEVVEFLLTTEDAESTEGKQLRKMAFSLFPSP